MCDLLCLWLLILLLRHIMQLLLLLLPLLLLLLLCLKPTSDSGGQRQPTKVITALSPQQRVNNNASHTHTETHRDTLGLTQRHTKSCLLIDND